jgi:hypothetical protein
MRLLLRSSVTCLLVIVCALLTSCGYGVREITLPETGATLEGTVTYGTEAVPAAMVIVTGQKGSANGYIDEATGRYSISNVPLGEVKVAVNVEPARGQMQGKMMSGYYQGPEAKKRGIAAPPKLVSVPAKYADPNTTTLTTTVHEGNNTFDIKIPK